MRWTALILIVSASACGGSDSPDGDEGALGGSCYPDNTCDGTAVCQRGICEPGPGTGVDSGAPDASTSDAAVSDASAFDASIPDAFVADAAWPEPGDTSLTDDEICDWAAGGLIPGFLDGYQTPADGQVLFCHESGPGTYVYVDSSIAVCVSHIGHAGDVFPSTMCDS